MQVRAIPFSLPSPEGVGPGQTVALIMQTDVTEQARVEQALVNMTEAQLFMWVSL